jgi:hypothetical protein
VVCASEVHRAIRDRWRREYSAVCMETPFDAVQPGYPASRIDARVLRISAECDAVTQCETGNKDHHQERAFSHFLGRLLSQERAKHSLRRKSCGKVTAGGCLVPDSLVISPGRSDERPRPSSPRMRRQRNKSIGRGAGPACVLARRQRHELHLTSRTAGNGR